MVTYHLGREQLVLRYLTEVSGFFHDPQEGRFRVDCCGCSQYREGCQWE